MTTRKYSSRSQQTTLTAGLTSSGTSATVVSGSALLGGVTISAGETFTVVIDPDTALEEIVDITAVSTNTLTITRGIDSSSGQAHSAGAVVRHMAIGRDYREANQHIENVTTAHGLTIADVITTTNTKTLTNKTLTNPTVTTGTFSTPALTTPTIAGATLSGAFTSTATITGGTITGAAVTGLSAPSSGSDATTKTYVDAILGSATSAGTSATSAATSASSSATSASSAATSATSSATSATAAATSATSASTSATASASSATTATNQATAATTSATSAATSATSSATSATSAAASATSAAASVSAVATSASSAATSATSSATSATSSATSATSSAASATSSANSYTAIVDQTGKGLVRDMGSIADADTTTDTYVGINALVSQATTSATSAATSATSSATSATSSAASATSAAASATAAAASYDSFDDRYLGAKSSAPSVDNDGNALITGALYFDTTTPGMYVWTGSAWTVMATSGDIESVTAGTGLSGGGTAGAVTVSLNTSSIYVVPSQTGSNGYFLTTNGTAASWTNLSDWGAL